MTLTPAMQDALAAAANQLVAGKAWPDAYSTPTTGGSARCRIDTLRALARRGLLVRAEDATEAYALTPRGLCAAKTTLQQRCREVEAEAKTDLASPHAGLRKRAENALAGVAEVLSSLDGALGGDR